MPTITRWFNVSHDINEDPEMWELREKFTDRAALIWLECLSIADRNSGIIGPASDQIRNQLASKCRTSRGKVNGIIEWCLDHGWIATGPASGLDRTSVEPRPGQGSTSTGPRLGQGSTSTGPASGQYLHVAKWGKYNKTRDAKKLPSYPNPPNPPILTKPKPPKSPKGGGVADLAFQRFWEAYPRKDAKKAAIKSWMKEAVYFTDIQDDIMAALERQKKQPQWLKDDGEFIPLPASWLNGRRWEDAQKVQLASVKVDPKRPVKVEPRPTEEEIQRGREFLRDTVGKLAGKMGIS